MLKNYIKVAFRTLLRHRSYSAINIFGLALGIAGATMLMMYVNNELSFDKFHSDSDRTYRLVTEVTDNDTRYYGANYTPLSRLMAEEMPEVSESLTLYNNRSQINFRLNDQRITEESWLMADPHFFDFFDFELIMGDKSTLLTESKSIVLSESLAQKYFGNKDPMGKLIDEFDWGEFRVTGIFKDLPENSHLQFDLIIDAQFRNDGEWQEQLTSWSDLSAFTYIKVNTEEELESLEKKMPALLSRHVETEEGQLVSLSFQNLEDIHFNSAHIGVGYDEFNKGDASYVLIFSSIALFLLVIAAVNYTNLATSKALFRSKEIGIRKVVGAQKRQIAVQFLAESLVITLMALILSIGLIDLTLPYFNDITGSTFEMNINSLADFIPVLVAITVLVGLMSGIYPALFVTRFQPVKVLKGKAGTEGKVSLKRVLVIVQFALSIIMIISTLVISGQMDYIRKSDHGFDTEGVLVIDINSAYARRDFKMVKERMAAVPGVETVAAASRVPGEWKRITEIDIYHRGTEEKSDPIRSFYMSFDKDVKSVFDFNLVEGEYFSGNDQTDSTKVLLNEAAVKALGLENPLGATVRLDRRGLRFLNATVIGIMEDFNYESFHSSISPLIVGNWNNGIRPIDYFALKLSTSSVTEVIDAVTEIHNEFDPATTIEYQFLDDQIALKYQAEQRAGVIFKMGAGLSIIVACLGLFGLASFTVQRRVKELGIRKVLGASHWNIFYLLSFSFTKLIVLALFLAIPLAYILMDNWLGNFAYRISLGLGSFFIAGIGTIFIALLTIGYTSIKAVVANPVDSLRNE